MFSTDHKRNILFLFLVIIDDFDFRVLIQLDVLNLKFLLDLFFVVDNFNHRAEVEVEVEAAGQC